MRILLVSKWVDGALNGDFHHSGEWIETFELALAFSALGNEVAIVTPAPSQIHELRFRKEFGDILKKSKIIHYFAKTQVTVGKYNYSSHLKLDLATLKAIKEFRPQIIQFTQITHTLTPIITKIPIFFYGIRKLRNYPGEAKDLMGKKVISSSQFSPILYLQNWVYWLTILILGKNNLYRQKGVTYILKHKEGYQFVKRELKITNRVFFVNKGVKLANSGASNKSTGQTILFLSSLTYRKGIFDLIKAFARIYRKFPHSKLLIGGSGPDGILRGINIQSKKFGKRIKLLGSVGYKEKKKVFAKAAVFCLPSYSDASPAALMEAMSFGLPIITTFEADPPITNNKEGILIKAGDIDGLARSIETLLKNQQHASVLGKAARKVAEQYSWENQAKKLLKIYQQEVNFRRTI